MSKEAMKLALEALENAQANVGEWWPEAITALREALAEQQEPVNKYCCHLCFNNTGQLFLDRMILCHECGNKRCPKATHHSLACTKSNDLGQKGSIYDQPLQQEPVAWRYLTQYDNQSVWTYCANEPANRETRQPLYTSPPAQQEPVERGSLRFYTNGVERQHWKADGSIDFKDKQGNVTMTIAAGSITSPQPSKPLTDEEIKELYGDDDNFRMTKKYVVAFARAIEAAHGIKENT